MVDDAMADDGGSDAAIEALAELYRTDYPRFLRLALAFVGSRPLAEDVVQEAFARAVRSRADLRDPAALTAWVWRTVTNVALTHLRRDRAAAVDELGDPVDPVNGSPELPRAAGGDRSASRASAASALPPPLRGSQLRRDRGCPRHRNGSHSAVEVAFSGRGRRYFADRAAARDLALFVRSHAQRQVRALAADAISARLARRYGASLTRLPRTGAQLAPSRIGYVVGERGVTFVERSTTGRRFVVVIEDGRIVRQNVRPLALVF